MIIFLSYLSQRDVSLSDVRSALYYHKLAEQRVPSQKASEAKWRNWKTFICQSVDIAAVSGTTHVRPVQRFETRVLPSASCNPLNISISITKCGLVRYAHKMFNSNDLMLLDSHVTLSIMVQFLNYSFRHVCENYGKSTISFVVSLRRLGGTTRIPQDGFLFNKVLGYFFF